MTTNKKIFLILLILAQIIILGIALYITGNAYNDLRHAVLSQMVNDQEDNLQALVDHVKISHKNIWSMDVITEHGGILRTHHDYAFVIAENDSTKRYPVMWFLAPRRLQKYFEKQTLREIFYSFAVELKNPEILNEIHNRIVMLRESEGEVFEYHRKDNYSGIAVWKIVPTPSVAGGHAVILSFVREQNTIEAIDEFHDKYLVLFLIGLIAVFATAVILPLELQGMK